MHMNLCTFAGNVDESPWNATVQTIHRPYNFINLFFSYLIKIEGTGRKVPL